ncbi:MAG: ferritin-like domain-containing protein [Acidocella sp.]|nr:ferritin-like domain-containing protein [Acidocella sp.]
MFNQQIVAENFFLKDVNALRDSVKPYLSAAPSADPTPSIALLQTVLAAEIVCVLRYTMISVSHDGLQNAWIGTEFQEQANDERKHMTMAAKRIQQLGGTPNFNPPGLTSRAAGPGTYDGNFAKQVNENLEAEQSVIAHYRDLITYFAPRDAQTCAMLEDIIRDEEDHTRDMADLLGAYSG